jgi:hypothetical protein
MAPLPYGYYTLLRWCICGASAQPKLRKFAGEKTIHGREEPLSVAGVYSCDWQDYSQFQPAQLFDGGLEFRYLIMKIRGEEKQV